MLDKRLIIDSHLHVGDAKIVKKIIDNSQYKNKYKLYQDLNYKLLYLLDDYIKFLNAFFAIPMIFKETNIDIENQHLHNFCLNEKKALEVPIIGGNDPKLNSLIFKEHFLVNDYNNIDNRISQYRFLNDNHGYLLIHSKDDIRIEYLNKLISLFPNINFIIAHMGRNTFQNFKFSVNIIDEFCSYENVLFDTSTIKNQNIVMYAIKRCGAARILYGTDYPYEKTISSNILDNLSILENINEKDKKLVLYDNANRIKKHCQKSR